MPFRHVICTAPQERCNHCRNTTPSSLSNPAHHTTMGQPAGVTRLDCESEDTRSNLFVRKFWGESWGENSKSARSPCWIDTSQHTPQQTDHLLRIVRIASTELPSFCWLAHNRTLTCSLVHNHAEMLHCYYISRNTSGTPLTRHMHEISTNY